MPVRPVNPPLLLDMLKYISHKIGKFEKKSDANKVTVLNWITLERQNR